MTVPASVPKWVRRARVNPAAGRSGAEASVEGACGEVASGVVTGTAGAPGRTAPAAFGADGRQDAAPATTRLRPPADSGAPAAATVRGPSTNAGSADSPELPPGTFPTRAVGPSGTAESAPPSEAAVGDAVRPSAAAGDVAAEPLSEPSSGAAPRRSVPGSAAAADRSRGPAPGVSARTLARVPGVLALTRARTPRGRTRMRSSVVGGWAATVSSAGAVMTLRPSAGAAPADRCGGPRRATRPPRRPPGGRGRYASARAGEFGALLAGRADPAAQPLRGQRGLVGAEPPGARVDPDRRALPGEGLAGRGDRVRAEQTARGAGGR